MGGGSDESDSGLIVDNRGINRNAAELSCQAQQVEFQQHLTKRWSEAEVKKLFEAVKLYKRDFAKIAKIIGTKTVK